MYYNIFKGQKCLHYKNNYLSICKYQKLREFYIKIATSIEARVKLNFKQILI